MIEKLEVSLINENVHNFKRGEFGVEKIEIDEDRGLIEICMKKGRWNQTCNNSYAEH